MKEYIMSVGTVMMMISFSLMLLPEGGLKRFASLAAGFMIICVVMSPLNKGKILDFSGISVENAATYPETDSAVYRAEVLKKHRENIEKTVQEHMKSGKAYAQIDNEGNITKITLRSDMDESRAVQFIVSTLGLPRERIVVTDEDN